MFRPKETFDEVDYNHQPNRLHLQLIYLHMDANRIHMSFNKSNFQ